MKTSALKCISPAVLSMLLLGCQSPHNFSHIQVRNIESPEIKSDPSRDLGGLRRFAVVPKDDVEDKLMQKQIIYLAASYLEGCGYEHVETNANPDFLLTVAFANEYHSTYVPPSSYSVPVYNPGQTYISDTNAYVFSPYGNLYGSSQTRTTTPGYWTSQTYTNPGYVG